MSDDPCNCGCATRPTPSQGCNCGCQCCGDSPDRQPDDATS